MPGKDGNTRQITESDLEDLRNKFHLLEGDRKAYYEMSMHTMKSNKALVAQLRSENKEVRRALASIQRERAASTKAGTTVDEEEEVEMEREVNRLRKMCDQYTNKAAGMSFFFLFVFLSFSQQQQPKNQSADVCPCVFVFGCNDLRV